MRSFGFTVLGILLVAAVGAPVLAPYAPDAQFRGRLNAPPTLPHLVDDGGAWHAPFIYPWTLTNQLEQRCDRSCS